MKIGIMQPYFFPYIGYWQLIHAVDKFVVYDNIQYSKGGWINRNRILVEGKDKFITLPLKKDSDYLDIRERFLVDDFPSAKRKILNQIIAAYHHAPQFETVFPLIKICMDCENRNLFCFLYHSIEQVMKYLGIHTEIVISSALEMDTALKKEYRVCAICNVLGGNYYINPIGGTELYQKEFFEKKGIKLNFIQSCVECYQQNTDTFFPNLSIIDVLMYNPIEQVRIMLDEFTLR